MLEHFISITDCPTFSVGKIGITRRRGEPQGGSKIILPQKSLKSWYSDTPFLVFWEHNFCLKCLIIRLWFLILIYMASRTSMRFYFTFDGIFKVFWCISFHYLYSDMHSCVNITRIRLESSEQISKTGVFLSRSHIGWDSEFSSKIERIPTKLGWLDSLRSCPPCV